MKRPISDEAADEAFRLECLYRRIDAADAYARSEALDLLETAADLRKQNLVDRAEIDVESLLPRLCLRLTIWIRERRIRNLERWGKESLRRLDANTFNRRRFR